MIFFVQPSLCLRLTILFLTLLVEHCYMQHHSITHLNWNKKIEQNNWKKLFAFAETIPVRLPCSKLNYLWSAVINNFIRLKLFKRMTVRTQHALLMGVVGFVISSSKLIQTVALLGRRMRMLHIWAFLVAVQYDIQFHI